MKTRTISRCDRPGQLRLALFAGGLAAASFAGVAMADDQGTSGKKTAPASDQADPDATVAAWPARPRLAALQMMEKYGAPSDVSAAALIWRDAGPYKRITVLRDEVPHDFPKPHMDFLEHTIAYDVPTDKIEDLIAFDASITVNKTVGEMSARCDLEGHNILTHNLAHDVVQGTKTVAEARAAFVENVIDDVLGKHPAYVEKLQFDVPDGKVAFLDVPEVPGSPVRPTGSTAAKKGGDAEILATLIAIDENEVLAAMHASREKVGDDVAAYATMMHTEHGKHAAATMKLGQKLKLTPSDTKKVDRLRVKGAAQLATLVPLDGNEFAVAYMDAMVKGHEEVLTLLDASLKTVKKAALKKHLRSTRKAVAAHLEHAKKVRAGM